MCWILTWQRALSTSFWHCGWFLIASINEADVQKAAVSICLCLLICYLDLSYLQNLLFKCSFWGATLKVSEAILSGWLVLCTVFPWQITPDILFLFIAQPKHCPHICSYSKHPEYPPSKLSQAVQKVKPAWPGPCMLLLSLAVEQERQTSRIALSPLSEESNHWDITGQCILLGHSPSLCFLGSKCYS